MNNDNNNGFTGILGVLFFAGAYLLGHFSGKSSYKKELQQQSLDLELQHLRKENEELKKKVPQVQDGRLTVRF